MKFWSVVMALLALCCATAAAKPAESTKYRYYTISGDTPGKIYKAMVSRGPDVNGVNAYASTLATTSQSGRLVQGKSCRLENYKVKIDFVINLPRLSRETALTGGTLAKWSQFKSFLKLHEENHRSIWMSCARQLETRIRALNVSSCDELDDQASKLFAEMRSDCQLKHSAFDRAEQKRLLKHPFVKLVFGQGARYARKN